DLVNRGPRSLEVLRWCYRHQGRLAAVLGNHDLHLLARARAGKAAKKRDTLDAVLAAPDREELLDWLSGLPLIFRENKYLVLHGGLLPNWGADQALQWAAEAEAALRGPKQKNLLKALSEAPPREWNPGETGLERHRKFIQILTRLRICTAEGRMAWDFKGALEEVPAGYRAWFDIPESAHRDHIRIFGHWSALGLYVAANTIALDTGCVWGKQLTAYRLEDGRVFSVDCRDPVDPGTA
ncbi:MAG: symmetrical bis(5'-nucleosyl)-tetraphosphatase, partial [Candidatus Binatia bacterium]